MASKHYMSSVLWVWSDLTFEWTQKWVCLLYSKQVVRWKHANSKFIYYCVTSSAATAAATAASSLDVGQRCTREGFIYAKSYSVTTATHHPLTPMLYLRNTLYLLFNYMFVFYSSTQLLKSAPHFDHTFYTFHKHSHFLPY